MQPETASTHHSDSVKVEQVEKTVSKFLDALEQQDPAKMRTVMTEPFQATYNFAKFNQEQPETFISYKIVKVSKEAGSITVVADLIYENKKNNKQVTKQYSYNLVSEHDSNKLFINSEKPTKATKPFYKKPLVWIIAAVAVILVIFGMYWLVTKSNTSQNQQIIASDWQQITQGASNVNTLSQKATTDKTNYDNYTRELRTFNDLLADKTFKANQLKPTRQDQKDVDNYKNALSNMSSYISEAVTLSATVSDYSNSDNTKLQDLSSSAKTAVDNFQNNAKFLKNSMPSEIFNISETLSQVKQELDRNAQKAQEAKDAEKAAAAQDAANKNAVTTNVTTFQQGFIAGNANVMRPVMTTGFQSEYNFNQLNPDQRQYQYPASFRIISVNKQADGTYRAQVNVTYRYTDNPNQYTQGYTYSVINQSNKWLLNNESIGNGF